MRILRTMCLCALISNVVYSQAISYEALETSTVTNVIRLSSGDHAISGQQYEDVDPANEIVFGILELVNESGSSIKSLLFDQNANVHIVHENSNGEIYCIVDSAAESFEADELALYKVDAELNGATFISQLDFSNPSKELGKIYSIESLVKEQSLYVYGLGNVSQSGNKSFILNYDLESEQKISFDIISTAALTNSVVSQEYGVAFYSNGDMLQVSKRLSQGTGPMLSRHSIDGKELWNRELSKNYRFYDVEIDANDDLFLIGDLKIEAPSKTDYLGIIVKFDENGAWQSQKRIVQDPNLDPQTAAKVELHKIHISDTDKIYAFGMDGGSEINYIPIVFAQTDVDLMNIEISRFTQQPSAGPKTQSITQDIFIEGNKVLFFNNLFQFESNPQAISGLIDLDVLSDLEIVKDENFEVFPNPVYDNLFVKNNTIDKSQIKSLSIFNSTGQLMLHQSFQHHLDVTALNAGLHYLVIDKEKERRIVSFVKK